jgi:hypothetical protein
MPKITEERMREIMIGIYPSKQVIDSIINHPEIKSLFECGSDIVLQDVDHPYCPRRDCGKRQQNSELTCLFCGTYLFAPTEAIKESEVVSRSRKDNANYRDATDLNNNFDGNCKCLDCGKVGSHNCTGGIE